MRRFLKRLAPQLIASGLAALVGAVVGGWITSSVVSKSTQTNSYKSYLVEASRSLSLSQKGEFLEEDRYRHREAVAVLSVYASEEILCWAMAFGTSIDQGNTGTRQYKNLLSAVRYETTGKYLEGEAPIDICEIWPDRNQ